MSKGELISFENEMAKMALEVVKAEQSTAGMTFLSTKSGVLSYRGDPVAGNKLACVILSSPIERLFYSERYDHTKIVPPNCFAIGRLAHEMTPHPSVEKPQHTSCELCPRNEWGSSLQGGKGKACRETRRLLLIPVDAITTADAVAKAEVAALRPPVTSLKNYSNYVQTLAASIKRPPVAVISEISVVPDAKTQFKVNFNMVKPIAEPAIIKALMQRAEQEVERAIATAGEMGDDALTESTSTRF